MFSTRTWRQHETQILSIGIAVVLGIALAGYGSFHFAIYKHNREKLNDMGANQATFETFIKRVHKETPIPFTLPVDIVPPNTKNDSISKTTKCQTGRSPHEYKRAIDINLLSMKGHIRKRTARNLMKTVLQLQKRWMLGGNPVLPRPSPL